MTGLEQQLQEILHPSPEQLEEFGVPPSEALIDDLRVLLVRMQALFLCPFHIWYGSTQEVCVEWWEGKRAFSFFVREDRAFLLYVLGASDKPALLDVEGYLGSPEMVAALKELEAFRTRPDDEAPKP